MPAGPYNLPTTPAILSSLTSAAASLGIGLVLIAIFMLDQGRKVSDSDLPVREYSLNFQFAAHGVHEPAQRTDEHVCAVFYFGDLCLPNAKGLGQCGLCERNGLTKFGQVHFLTQSGLFGLYSRAALQRKILCQFRELSGHCINPPDFSSAARRAYPPGEYISCKTASPSR